MVVSRGAEGQRERTCISLSSAPLPTSTQQFWVGELVVSSSLIQIVSAGVKTVLIIYYICDWLGSMDALITYFQILYFPLPQPLDAPLAIPV
jgi:hypothetical protein